MNPYDVLGVPRGADLETCKRAFRALAMRHHPDRGGAAAEFAKVGRAWADVQAGHVSAAPNPRPGNGVVRRSVTVVYNGRIYYTGGSSFTF